MQPCLCKKHFRQVSNVFDKETAFVYTIDESNCVICNKVIFIEGARRYVLPISASTPQNASDETLRQPDAFVHKGK